MATLTVSTDTNYSSLSIADDDRITITQGAQLTINTDTVRLERILCTTFGTCLVENTSTTTPIFVKMGETGTASAQLRFEAGGVLRVRGAWIELGTSDGTANQTFTLPTNAGGDRYQELAGLQVQDGSDTLLFNRVNSLTNRFGDNKFGLVYTHDVATGVITFGDGTNGYIPPNGAIIKVPNIQFIDDHQGTGFNDFDFASSGTLDLDICAFAQNYGFNPSSASSVQIRNTMLDIPRETVNFAVLSAPIVRNFIVVHDTNSTMLSGSGCNNIDLDGARFYNFNASSGNSRFVLSNGSGGSVKNIVIVDENAPTTSSRALMYFTSANINVEDFYGAGRSMGLYLAAGSGGHNIKRCFFNAYGSRGQTGSGMATYFILVNTSNNFIEDCGFWPATEAEGLVAPYARGLYANTGASKSTFNNCDIWCGGASSPTRCVNPLQTNGVDIRFGNIDIYGDPSGDTINHSTGSVNITAVNVRFQDPETQSNDMEWCDGVFYNHVSSPDRIDTAPSNNGIDVASLLLLNSNDHLNGKLYRVMGVDNTLGLYTEVTKTGVITFNNSGDFFMGTAGDVVEFETFVHQGITGFTAALLEGSNASQFTCRFKMRRPNGTYGAYQDFTVANLTSALAALTGYTTAEGLQIKYEITRDRSNLTDILERIRADVTIESGFNAPFEVRPTDLTITGLSSGDAVYVEDASNNEKAYEVVSGSTFTMVLPNANDGETWTYAVKRMGYNHQRGTFDVTAGSDVNIAVSMTEKLQAVGGSMFTSSDVASIDVEFDLATPQMSIDISQSQTSPQNVFDKVERALITNDGMKWLAQQNTDTAFQNLGGAGSFLFHQNNIRLRRNTPTDTNAEVLAFVFSTDGIAVDETNGTVAVFSGTLVKDVWEGIIDDYDDVTGSFGKAMADMLAAITTNLDVAVSTRLASGSYTAPNNADIVNIKAKTDQLTFTTPNQIDANIQYVNDVEVTGTGSEGDEWGPSA